MNETDQGFRASLFYPELGNEVMEGKLFIDRWTVRFISESGTEEIPTAKAVIEIEADGDRIYFKDPARPELQIFTLDDSVLDHPALTQCRELRAQMTEIAGRAELFRRLRLTGYFAIGCLLLFWMGSMAMSLAVRSLVARVPPEWESGFGKEQIEMMQHEHLLLDDTNQVARLAALAEPLLKVTPLGNTAVTFYIADEDEPNAFALPGGYVVVNSGLLRMIDTPEELLGVLAHELGHVSERHFARSMISSRGPLMVFGVFLHSRNGVLNLLGAASGVMIAKGFSQEYETEADDAGWKYLVAANIDPRGMISMFRKFKAYEDKEEEMLKAMPHLPQAFNSHPALKKRIARLEARWNRLSKKSVFIELTNPVPRIDPSESRGRSPELP